MVNVINLDENFNPFENSGHNNITGLFKFLRFSGGELHVQFDKDKKMEIVDDYIIITQRIKNSDDLMKILILRDALDRISDFKIDLVIPYVPYARQDRVNHLGESFTLKVFAELINKLHFNNVFFIDAHSDVTSALINNAVNISNNFIVNDALTDIKQINDNKDVLLISPDSGANKKSNKLFMKFKSQSNQFSELIKCDKMRDTATGQLSGFQIFANDLEGKDCLIVDDICDGGRTFIGIAQELKKKNAGNIYLFVTHGIFSHGFEELNKYFSKIYCTNSFSDVVNENVKQLKIEL